MAHKALAVNTKKLVEFEANYESTISLTEHERVLSELEQEKRQIVKLQEDLDGYSSRYEYCSDINILSIEKTLLDLFIYSAALVRCVFPGPE